MSQALKQLLVKLRHNLNKDNFEPELPNVIQQLTELKILESANSIMLNNELLVLMTDILHLIVSKRQAETYREAIIKGELGRQFDEINNMVSYVVYQHAIFQNKLDDYLLSPKPNKISEQTSTEKILDDAENLMMEATEKLMNANKAVEDKNEENEQQVQRLKAAKFNNKEKQAGITEAMKIETKRLINEMFILNAAAALTADTAVATRIYYESMLKQYKDVITN